jgi:RNA polymerase sigma factor (sigma-70 family)
MEHVTTTTMANKDTEITGVFNSMRGQLMRFIRQRVRVAEDAEDILQDVFSQFVEVYRTIEGIYKTGAWLYTVARNKIIDKSRKKKPETFSNLIFSSAADEDSDGPNLEDLIPDLSGMPDEQYARNLIMNRIAEALDELPVDQRQVFVWHEFEDKSFKEIAEETGVTVNTALSRKHYAVRYLRLRLQDLYDELA